jgi:hypothetical protein
MKMHSREKRAAQGESAVFDTLLIAASFFGYAHEIRRELEGRGRRVLWFEDRPGLETFTKVAVRVAPFMVAGKRDAYLASILQAAREQPIRDVLIIKGEALTASVIRCLRAALPNASFALFFWDSYRNMPPGSADKVALFDRAFTFDQRDADNDKRLRYRPLFYLPEYATANTDVTDIDVLFTGTMHSDRYAILKRLARMLPRDQRFEKVLYVPSRAVFAARRMASPAFWTASRREFVFAPLPISEVVSLVSRARIMVDIQRPIQTGYTIRTIEALGAGRKLITTNPYVRRADFYSEQNVAIIDRASPSVCEEFLRGPALPAADAMVRRYTLAAWVDQVLPDRVPSSGVRYAA